ncbi:MAG: tail fiber protein [Solirubrobacteraceae bacterium]
MSEGFLGELRTFAFGFPPRGWALCNGQTLPINQNAALFSLLGTTYGGNGTTTFNLPNLQARVPLHFSSGLPEGTATGEAAHTLSVPEMAAHTHPLNGTATTASTDAPGGNLLAAAGDTLYAAGPASSVTLAPATVLAAGGGQPHENRQPFLTLNVCIALVGIFPTRN